MSLVTETGAGRGPNFARRLSLPTLFLIGHAPLVAFAIGMGVVSAALVPTLQHASDSLVGVVGGGEASRGAVNAFTGRFIAVWLWCLGAFYVASAVGSVVVAVTHRTLSRRLRRIVAHAEQLGSGHHEVGIEVEADDVLGKLETALTTVGRDLSARDAARKADAEHREQLARMQHAMSMVESEDDALRVVGRALFTLIRNTPAELLMADATNARLHRVAGSSTATPPGCAVTAPRLCPAVHLGSTLTFSDSEALDACPRLLERVSACSAVCVPVVVMGRAAGVLHATRPQGQGFPPETVLALETLSGLFGTRAGLMRALGSAQLQAETDALTGLLNRRSLETKATELLASSRTVSLAMADLDHFKRLNDTHGHGAGDRALRTFAQVLRSTLRPGDVIARYGGEEFTILLADCSADQASHAVERVRAALKARCAEGEGPSFTASFGVCDFPRHGDDLESLLRIADKALYQAKEGGRDRVMLAL